MGEGSNPIVFLLSSPKGICFRRLTENRVPQVSPLRPGLSTHRQPDSEWGRSVGWRLFGGLGHEVDEVLLPDDGLGVGAVAAGGVGDGDEDELRVGHAGDHLFGDAELGRVDEVVGGVDPEDGRGDGGELGLGVVVARGVDVVEEVVGVGVGDGWRS